MPPAEKDDVFYAELKTEINTDPQTIGYAAQGAGDNQAVADQMNSDKDIDGQSSPYTASVDREFLQVNELQESVVDIEAIGDPNLNDAATQVAAIAAQGVASVQLKGLPATTKILKGTCIKFDGDDQVYEIKNSGDTDGAGLVTKNIRPVLAAALSVNQDATLETGLSLKQQWLWDGIIRMGVTRGVNILIQNIRDQLASLWPPQSTTRVNMGALQTKQGSRGEEIWGDTILITSSDVARAIALP